MESILTSVPVKENKEEQTYTELKNQTDQPIRAYDFSQKDRLSRESQKTLEHIHENFSKEMGAFISGKLRVDGIVQLISQNQFSMNELLESINNPACLFVFEILEHERNAVFEIHPDLVFLILDKILGGPGTLAELNRELTKIEQTIIKQFVEEFLNILKIAWKNTATFDTTIRNYYSNANYLTIAESGESVITLTFELEVGEIKQLISLTYPYFLIERLIPTLDGQNFDIKVRSSPKEREMIINGVNQTTLPIVVNLGKTKLSVEKLLNLKINDVVMLDKRVHDELELGIGNKTRFHGKAGLFHDHLAFKVTRKALQ
jgi:flagellar motor switch protein FliM